MNYELIIPISLAYLIGSIPTGLLLTKLISKQDIRNIGSGNTGTTNVLRTGNKLLGLTTLFIDIGKPLAIITIIQHYTNNIIIILASIIFCFLGNVFPIWLKFKGGKGIATYLGLSLSISTMMGLTSIITLMITILCLQIVSISSLTMCLVTVIYSYFFLPDPITLTFSIMSLLCFYTHRQNIRRIRKGTEPKLGQK